MNRSQFIAKRLSEVYLDGHWVANTNYKEQLSSLHWQQATQQVGPLNTIALLTYHINYYLRLNMVKRLLAIEGKRINLTL